jgi:hypothetical protein
MNTVLEDIQKQRVALLLEREIGRRIEYLIPKMQSLAQQFDIGEINETSPLRNILTVATQVGSGVETTKNYILYQLGRSGSSKIWQQRADNKRFGVAVVEILDDIKGDAEEIIEAIEKECKIENGKLPNREDWVKEAHLKLMQLYLGNLGRYHAFLKSERTRGGRE